ncbi:hypothetical protein J4210_02955 [Candidatus Woesearchaeota archaeon]|nr:hypothetical protein [Candidatus Woesearchaeota archaeon]
MGPSLVERFHDEDLTRFNLVKQLNLDYLYENPNFVYPFTDPGLVLRGEVIDLRGYNPPPGSEWRDFYHRTLRDIADHAVEDKKPVLLGSSVYRSDLYNDPEQFLDDARELLEEKIGQGSDDQAEAWTALLRKRPAKPVTLFQDIAVPDDVKNSPFYTSPYEESAVDEISRLGARRITIFIDNIGLAFDKSEIVIAEGIVIDGNGAQSREELTQRLLPYFTAVTGINYGSRLADEERDRIRAEYNQSQHFMTLSKELKRDWVRFKNFGGVSCDLNKFKQFKEFGDWNGATPQGLITVAVKMYEKFGGIYTLSYDSSFFGLRTMAGVPYQYGIVLYDLVEELMGECSSLEEECNRLLGGSQRRNKEEAEKVFLKGLALILKKSSLGAELNKQEKAVIKEIEESRNTSLAGHVAEMCEKAKRSF